MTFSDLELSEGVLKAVTEAGYSEPTPVQEQAIPYVLMGRDILTCAQTGTGKTAAFTLPMIDVLSLGQAKARMPRSLIIEPTRELAAQVGDHFETYGKYHKLNKALLIGGVSLDDQIRLVDRGVDVLIATPGRLLDLFDRGRLLLTDVKILVIDEADRMLDMGFIPDVERIVSLTPKMRQTLLLSATMPREIRRLAEAFLINPKEIHVDPPATPAETVVQGLLMVPPAASRRPGAAQKEKREALRHLIRNEVVSSALVFCNRKRDVGVLRRSLVRHGFSAIELHGDMSQPARMETLAAFKDGGHTFLVCSDVAARGLDIAGMSHVFNFDVPTHAEDYVHRIGRTGRAGRAGRGPDPGTSRGQQVRRRHRAARRQEDPAADPRRRRFGRPRAGGKHRTGDGYRSCRRTRQTRAPTRRTRRAGPRTGPAPAPAWPSGTPARSRSGRPRRGADAKTKATGSASPSPTNGIGSARPDRTNVAGSARPSPSSGIGSARPGRTNEAGSARPGRTSRWSAWATTRPRFSSSPATRARRVSAMQTIFVQVKCQLGEAYTVADKAVERVSQVSEVYSTSGMYDLLVKCHLDDDADIGHFVTQEIQTLPGVKDTFTVIAFKAFN